MPLLVVIGVQNVNKVSGNHVLGILWNGSGFDLGLLLQGQTMFEHEKGLNI